MGAVRAVAGIDSSTQQTKLVVVDVATGRLLHSSALPHPDGTQIDPAHWWAALEGVGAAAPPNAEALSIAAQQHTTIVLDERGEVLRPALLWNDLRATECARDLRSERGDAAWLDGVGLLPDSAHPVSKLRWIALHEPATAARVASVMLPHDWLTWRLLGQGRAAAIGGTTDRSDASATGYWSPGAQEYRMDLVEHALGHEAVLPRVLEPAEWAGVSRTGLRVAAGCGDNAATHLALDTRVGDMVISIGTSATISMRVDSPVFDPDGRIDTMADARSGFIPIVALLNGARVLTATAGMLGVGLDHLERLARDAPPDARGVVFVPHLDGERNPPAAASSGGFLGLSRQTMTPAIIARAALLGIGCAIADAVDDLRNRCGAPSRILVVGGGARSAALRQLVADLVGDTVLWPEHREHAAFGAARQAAWALLGTPPDWPQRAMLSAVPAGERGWVGTVRERHREARGADPVPDGRRRSS